MRFGDVSMLLALLAGGEAAATAEPWLFQASGPNEWRLEARQADLSRLVAEIARRGGVQVHYSVLPEAKVDAVCIGDAVALLQCVLGGSANMAYRKSPSAKGYGEIWIMGSRLSVGPACTVGPNNAGNDGPSQANKPAVDRWLKQLRDKDPEKRAQAAAELAETDPAHDREADAALRKAFKDQDPRVRMQALEALTKREGELGAMELLRQALNDGNAEVRVNAVDRIDSDVTLLEMAARDGDANVRELARVKLEQLTKP